MKAFLYLYSSDIRYRVSNFTVDRVKPLEGSWDEIENSIVAVFDLVRDFGYNDVSLTSKNALLPIIYWVHHKSWANGLTTKPALREQRSVLRAWLHTVLLKGTFGSAADTILAAIRRAFLEGDFGQPFIRSDLDGFPALQISTILKSHGKDPSVTDEFIDSILTTQYEERLAFTILAILSPNLDYKNGNFHKDHLHPGSGFQKRKLTAAGIQNLDFYLDTGHWNSILNLSHLDGSENQSKLTTPLNEWVRAEAERQGVSLSKFCLDHLLPADEKTLEFDHFAEFIAARRLILGDRLRLALEG